MEGWLDKFKDYVPAEILAAFITINSLVPYREDLDLKVIGSAAAVLTLFYIISSVRAVPRKPMWVIIMVTCTLPLWCLLIAVERVDNYYSSGDVRIFISVLLVLVSVGLTMFGPKQPAPAGQPT